MEESRLESRISAIEHKLDIILGEIELQRRHRQERDDLKDDLMRVGKEVYRTAVVELEEMHDQLQTVDVIHLGKKLLRNINTITRIVEQMESIKDFLEDAAPLARESFIALMARLDELDRKGYFVFLKELGRVMDAVVTSFRAEDVRALGENAVTILTTVKNLTQPEMLQSVNNALAVYRNLDIAIEEDISLIKLFREMNTPEMKRGLAYAIAFLKNIAAQQPRAVSHE